MGLTLGGISGAGSWGVPSPLYNFKTGKYETGGLIWYGRKPATAEDKASAKSVFGSNVFFDSRSLVGMDSSKYATFFSAKHGKGPYKPPVVKLGKTKSAPKRKRN